jgi:PIN domain nuclease of toxin-antitoxin system
MSRYLLDACALIAFFNKEEGADVVESLFENKAEIFVSIVNVYEVYYDACRTDGEEKAKELLADIEKLPIKIIRNIDKEVIIKAARFKVDFSISLADSIALGLGKELSAKVVTADHYEFDKIEEKKSADFYWIR